MSLQTTRALALALAVAAALAAPAAAAPWSPGRGSFADDAFRQQWARTDDPRVRGGRGWYWGPAPWFDYAEFNRQSPGGLRLVQYFDKARMELGAPGAQVTNGLLVVELVTGYQKLGDAPDDEFARAPAYIPVAGDPFEVNQDAPTYASFVGVATTPGAPRRSPDRRGQPVSAAIDRTGDLSERGDLAGIYRGATTGAAYVDVTGHTVPDVFWKFLGQRGRLAEGAAVRTGQLIDWVQVMGYPITDAYWVRTRVGGQERDVLVQLFERRVLTFTPANPPAQQVEMGNVGQHYFLWRYPQLGRPWDTPPADLPIVYAAGAPGDRSAVAAVGADGAGPTQLLAPDGSQPRPRSVRQAYGAPAQAQVLFDSLRGDGAYRQIYAAPIEPGAEVVRLTYTDTSPPFAYSPFPPVQRPSNEAQPAISPDGTKLAFVSDRAGRPQIFLAGYVGGGVGTVGDQVQLTAGDCSREAPAWSPDGRSLVWMEDCGAGPDIVRGDLAYAEDSQTFQGRYIQSNLSAQLVGVRRLTDDPQEDAFPRFSPDGALIAFQSRRDGGVSHIFTVPAAGGPARQLTSGPFDDITPAWSPDGRRLAFASVRDGDWDIYRLDPDGAAVQLTFNTADDRWPVWAP